MPSSKCLCMPNFSKICVLKSDEQEPTLRRRYFLLSRSVLSFSTISLPSSRTLLLPPSPALLGTTRLAGVNLLSYTVYLQLGLGELKLTPIILQLADRSTKKPQGIIEDVIIQVNNLYFPVDFIALHNELVANPTKMIHVILGRPFLTTANANINCWTRIMKIKFGNLKVKLNIFHTFQQTPDKVECLFLDSVEDLVAEPLPCILTKDPFETNMTHIMVDNCNRGQNTGRANSWLHTNAKLDVAPLAIPRTSRLLLPGITLS
jgi:hypothetical protein